METDSIKVGAIQSRNCREPNQVVSVRICHRNLSSILLASRDHQFSGK